MEFASFDDYRAPYVGRDGPGAENVQSLDAALAWAVKAVAPLSD